MLYFACSHVTSQDLEHAAQYVEDTLRNKEAIDDFLFTQEVWIDALKEHAALEYEAIEEEIGKMMEEGVSVDEINQKRTALLKKLTRTKRLEK